MTLILALVAPLAAGIAWLIADTRRRARSGSLRIYPGGRRLQPRDKSGGTAETARRTTNRRCS